MKKLFALVLVLAMALAIAVPALAATGWDALPEDPETYVDFEMLAAKYEWYGSTAAGYPANGGYFANWDDNKGVVKDTLGRAYFEITIPSYADIHALYPEVSFSELKIKVTITNVKAAMPIFITTAATDPAVDYNPTFATPAGSISSKNVFTDDWAAGTEYTIPVNGTPGTAQQNIRAMYVFRAAEAADVVATISVTAGDTTLPATFLYKGVTLTADATTDNGCEWDFTNGTTGDSILFDTTTGDKIQRVFIYDVSETTYYQVLIDVNGVISFKDGAASIQVGDTDYAALKALYDFFMGALGFQWDGTAKYMNDDLILLNLIKGATGSASVKFPAGYQSIVDPTVQPPQTGDATTVVGFVMIALALVAAAVVTVKKVRA